MHIHPWSICTLCEHVCELLHLFGIFCRGHACSSAALSLLGKQRERAVHIYAVLDAPKGLCLDRRQYVPCRVFGVALAFTVTFRVRIAIIARRGSCDLVCAGHNKLHDCEMIIDNIYYDKFEIISPDPRPP